MDRVAQAARHHRAPRPLIALLCLVLGGLLPACAPRTATPPAAPAAEANPRRALACAAPDVVAPPTVAPLDWPSMDSPDGKIIRRLTIEGSRSLPTAWLQGLSTLKVGERFDPQEAEALVLRLQGLEAFEDVRLLAEVRDDGVELVFQVVERPTIRGVYFAPGSVTPAAAEWSAPRPGDLYDPASVGRSLRSLDRTWMATGKLDRVIGVRARRDGDVVDLCLQLEPGPEWKIERLDFSGNHLATAEELRATLGTEQWNAPERHWRADIFEQNLVRMEVFYYERGAINVRVGPPQVERLTSGKLAVTIPVREGPAFRLGRLEIRGSLAAPAAVYLEQLGARSGDLFARSRVFDGLQRIQERHRALTGRDATAKPTATTRADGLVDLIIEITEK